MTSPNAELVEMVARQQYERCAARFADDPVTKGLDGFAEQVFPPWDETRQDDWLEDAAAILTAITPVIRREAIEEAAKHLEAWGDIYGRNAAAAIRAYISP